MRVEEACYSPMIRSKFLSKPVPLTVNFPSPSQLPIFYPLRWDRKAREDWSWFPSNPLYYNCYRLWWNSSLLRVGLKSRVLWYILKWLLSPPLTDSTKEIFLQSSPWEPGRAPKGKTHKSGSPHKTRPLGVFNSQICPL